MPTEIVHTPANPLTYWGRIGGVGLLLGFMGGFLLPGKAVLGGLLYVLGYYLGKRGYWDTPALPGNGNGNGVVIDVET